MPREIITIGAGQCGNQVSANFWEKLCREHGIAGDGTVIEPERQTMDRRDAFFYQSDDARYIPRAVLVDLEPRVLNMVTSSPYGTMYNPENVFHPSSGTGAGNIWASGYYQGGEYGERLFDILDREMENSDSLDSFMLMHSVGGGTGSGLGSFLLEEMRDRYTKTVIQTVSIFPTVGTRRSDNVVQPYNAMLSLKRLREQADSVLVYDNNALDRISSEALPSSAAAHVSGRAEAAEGQQKMDYNNSFVSASLLAATSTLRFPTYAPTRWTSTLSMLIPSSAFHFLTTSYTPVVNPSLSGKINYTRQTTVTEIMRRLLQPKYVMVDLSPSSHHTSRYLSLLRIIQGDVDMSEYKKLSDLRNAEGLKFVDQYPDAAQMVVARRSPYIEHQTRLSGAALANTTAVVDCFERTLAQFEPIFTRAAFLSEFRKYPMFQDGNELEEFGNVHFMVEDLIKSYHTLENSIQH